MKGIFLGLLLVISSITVSFAKDSATPPIGFMEMVTSLSSVSSPNEANGKIFELRMPDGFESYRLGLSPKSVFAVSNLKDGLILVSITNAEDLYDMDFFNVTGIILLKAIQYQWRLGDDPPCDTCGGFKSCSVDVGFKVSNTLVTKSILDYLKTSNYDIQLKYDKSIFEYTGNTDNGFVFKRKSNESASATLTIKKTDGSLMAQATIDNIARCEQGSAYPNWSEWSGWNSCSDGKQSRTRECLTENVGRICFGNSFEERECNSIAHI